MEKTSLIIGRVIVPTDVDRDSFVGYCLRANVVSVATSDGELYKDCPIVVSVFGEDEGFVSSLDFPIDSNGLGSTVVMVTEPKGGKPMVLGCLSTKDTYFGCSEEKQILIKRTWTDDDGLNAVQVDLSGRRGIISIMSDAEGAEGGNVLVRAKNGENKGELELKADLLKMYFSNDVVWESETNVTMTVIGTLEKTVKEAYNMTVSNPSTWEFEDDVTLHSQSTAKFDADSEVQLGSGNYQPVLLGDDTVDRLDDIVGLVGDLAQALLSFTSTNAAIGAPVASGVGTITSATQILAQAQVLSGQLTLLKSQKVKTE